MAAGACGLGALTAPPGPAEVACIMHARQTAPRSDVAMGPLDGATLARFALGVFFWEGLFRIVQLLSASRTRRRQPLSREERLLWFVSVPSYATSTVHALLMTWRGARHLAQLWPAPEAEKHVIVPGGLAYDGNQAVELSNWLFFCYMSYDLGHVVAAYPQLGGIDTLLHHAAFFVAALVAGSQRAFNFAFGWLVLCEASTPFLNARWFYRTLKKRDSEKRESEKKTLSLALATLGIRDAEKLAKVIDVGFAVTFILTRVVGYGLGFTHSLRGLWLGYYAPIQPWAWRTMFSLVGIGGALNLLWASRIVAAMMRKGGQGGGSNGHHTKAN